MKQFSNFNNQTPGFAALVTNGEKILLEKYVGVENMQTKNKINKNSKFRLASLSKPFTATAILILVKQNKLQLTDTIDTFVPELKFGKEITIAQLLSHTSGMPDHEKILYKNLPKKNYINMYDALNVLIKQNKLLFKPEKKFLYSDAAYVILAIIIEKVTNMPFAKFIKKEILKKLNMKNTIVVDNPKIKITNRAIGYKKEKGQFKIFDNDPLNYIVGDEGIYSTILDVLIFAKSWNTNILLSKKTRELAFTPFVLKNNKFGECGLCWFVNKKYVFQDGIWVGFTNILLMIPEKKIIAIMLSNTNLFATEKQRILAAKKLLKKAGIMV